MKALLFVIAASAVWAGTLPSISEIIAGEGKFAFTDGSSVYRFTDDGGFLMEPLSLCGRAIEGTWTSSDPGVFTISGLWTWYNGTSPIDDFRRMTLFVTLLSTEPDTVESLWNYLGERVYPVYFTIDEIVETGGQLPSGQ